MRPCLILGGAGNFGKRIAQALVRDQIPVILAGRSQQALEEVRHSLDSPIVHTACFDAFATLNAQLAALAPSSVVNTVGPFQLCDYSIAKTCIDAGVHYIDLADARDFVTGITALDPAATAKNVAVISGASTVPALSSTVVEAHIREFSKIDDMTFGISPGQKAERGLATTQGILSYVGKRLRPFPSCKSHVYGWQDVYRQHFPDIGSRWMANCDVPDLDLLPERYGIGTIRFSAGLELGGLHLGLWALSWLVRMGLPVNLARYARPLLKASNMANRFGSADGGMFVSLRGKDQAGQALTRTWFIIAFDGYGPHIPTVPAILLAKQCARGEMDHRGAKPCVGLISLDAYVAELVDGPVKVYTR